MKKFLVLAIMLAPFVSLTDAAAASFDYTAEEKVSFETTIETPAPTGEKNIFEIKF